MSNSPNIDLVLKHLAGFENIENYLGAISETVTDDIYWFNSGFNPYSGLENVRNGLRGFGMKFRGIRIECVNICDDGNKVWTERIDYMIEKDGKTGVALPCMGIFEIENGRIKSWRDYFDGAAFK